MRHQSVDVLAASYRLQRLAAIADDVLPTLAAVTDASFAFFHDGASCGSAKVVTWPESDVVRRYHGDYVTDSPFESIKAQAAGWIVPITRRLSRRRLVRTAFYTDLLHPADLEHHVELRFDRARGGAPGAGIILCRSKRAGEFDDDALATVAALRPPLLAAFRRARELERALDRVHALEAILTIGDAQAIRLAVDADGGEVYLHPPAAKIDPLLLTILREPCHPLRVLARDVARGRPTPADVGATVQPLASSDGVLYTADVFLAPAHERRPLAIVSLAPRRVAPEAAWKLSPAEAAVLEQILAGRSNEDIGRHLFISPETVRTHCTRIYRKMGVRSRLEAAALARARDA
jgi:DNA-binding CsgD family transcriptional regulator